MLENSLIQWCQEWLEPNCNHVRQHRYRLRCMSSDTPTCHDRKLSPAVAHPCSDRCREPATAASRMLELERTEGKRGIIDLPGAPTESITRKERAHAHVDRGRANGLQEYISTTLTCDRIVVITVLANHWLFVQ